MYKTILVTKIIEDGATLLKALDDKGVPVRAAVWFNDPEKMGWKLIIVTPVATTPGPLEAYLQIQFAMTNLDVAISLDDIIVMSPDSRKFEEFKRAMEGAARGALLKPNVIFDDAYVYRWHSL